VRLAKPAEVLRITGYRVGGVPPVGHRTPVRVLMDRTLLTFDRVYAAAGSPVDIFEIAPDRLQTLARAEVVDIVQ
jgi:prolyl-tRNA editing enzyme YbaK/EbsC (Cys-tRNA(Pro) deacylase)